MKENSRKLKIETCIKCPSLYYVERSGMNFPKCFLSEKELGFGKIEDKTKFSIDNSTTIPEWCKLKFYNE